jgi:hypothetical protein
VGVQSFSSFSAFACDISYCAMSWWLRYISRSTALTSLLVSGEYLWLQAPAGPGLPLAGVESLSEDHYPQWLTQGSAHCTAAPALQEGLPHHMGVKCEFCWLIQHLQLSVATIRCTSGRLRIRFWMHIAYIIPSLGKTSCTQALAKLPVLLPHRFSSQEAT